LKTLLNRIFPAIDIVATKELFQFHVKFSM